MLINTKSLKLVCQSRLWTWLLRMAQSLTPCERNMCTVEPNHHILWSNQNWAITETGWNSSTLCIWLSKTYKTYKTRHYPNLIIGLNKEKFPLHKNYRDFLGSPGNSTTNSRVQVYKSSMECGAEIWNWRQGSGITTSSTTINYARNLNSVSFIINCRPLRSCYALKENKTKILLARTAAWHQTVHHPASGMSETFGTAQKVSSFIAGMAS